MMKYIAINLNLVDTNNRSIRAMDQIHDSTDIEIQVGTEDKNQNDLNNLINQNGILCTNDTEEDDQKQTANNNKENGYKVNNYSGSIEKVEIEINCLNNNTEMLTDQSGGSFEENNQNEVLENFGNNNIIATQKDIAEINVESQAYKSNDIGEQKSNNSNSIEANKINASLEIGILQSESMNKNSGTQNYVSTIPVSNKYDNTEMNIDESESSIEANNQNEVMQNVNNENISETLKKPAEIDLESQANKSNDIDKQNTNKANSKKEVTNLSLDSINKNTDLQDNVSMQIDKQDDKLVNTSKETGNQSSLEAEVNQSRDSNECNVETTENGEGYFEIAIEDACALQGGCIEEISIKTESDSDEELSDLEEYLKAAEVKDEMVETTDSNTMALAMEFLKNEPVVVLQRAEMFQCPLCRCAFLSHRQRELHIVNHVSTAVISKKKHANWTQSTSNSKRFIKRYPCPDCDASFVQKSTLDTHSIVHKPFPYNCECGIGYFKKDDRDKHIELVHGDDEAEVWLPMIKLKPKVVIKCRSSISSEASELKSDAESDDWATKKPTLKAKVVKKVTNKVVKVEKPKRKRVQKKYPAKPTECPVCKKVLSSKRNMEVHLRVHTGERPYKCDICDASFTQWGSQKAHKLTHTSEKNFKCSFCGKAFQSKHNMFTHEQIHMDTKPYVCQYCKKGFNDRSAQLRHERTHTGDKRYKCEHCPKAFTDASGLRMHRKRHIGDKNFKCNKCTYTCYDKSALAKHNLVTHTKIKEFRCDDCGKLFALKQYLFVHMKHSHAQKEKAKHKNKAQKKKVKK